MSNYDFGYNIQAGSTMEWAIKLIRNNSEILELGPAIGTLTKHLKEDKNCEVDIVEIDKESGNRALKYARSGCIGIDEGNLETNAWYEKYKNNKYDYIVILDVLEHLRNAKELLKKVRLLLKNEGEIILSVPNIGHNSIIIELLCNKFHYTNVGLLDKTHLHFYTYETLCNLIKESGLDIFEQKVHQLRVGENEINNSYGDVPAPIAAFLRTREYADVYQFLFRIKKNCVIKCQKLEVENLPYTLYQFLVLNSKLELIWKEFINPSSELNVEFSTLKEKDIIRITPLNDYCVMGNMSIQGYDENNKEVELSIKKTTAACMEKKYIFMDQDPQIFVEKPEGIIRIKISGQFLSYGDDNICYVFPFWKKILEQKVIINDYKNSIETRNS